MVRYHRERHEERPGWGETWPNPVLPSCSGRAARDFFRDFGIWGPEIQKNRWPAGACGSDTVQNSLMIGNILEIDRLSKDCQIGGIDGMINYLKGRPPAPSENENTVTTVNMNP